MAALLVAQATVAGAEEKTVLIATWRGCEDACLGFRDYLQELGHDIAFIQRDAAQDMAALPAIRADARSLDVDLILAWGTSVAQAIAGRLEDPRDPAVDGEIPVVFTIVADPVGSGIVASLDAPGRPNVTGTHNRMPETVTIQTIRNYRPDFHRLGLLFNTNEPNSELKRQEMQALAEAEGFELVALPIMLGSDGLPLPEDIAPKVRALAAADVDFIYVGSSSFLRANAALFGAATRDAGLPLISPYEEMVQGGNSLISVAARYYDVGRLAGRQAEAILFEGKKAGDLPVAQITQFAVTINLSVARATGHLPPISLLQIAETVE